MQGEGVLLCTRLQVHPFALPPTEVLQLVCPAEARVACFAHQHAAPSIDQSFLPHVLQVTHDALMLAIAACKPGMRYRDIGDIITKHASKNG